MFKWNIRAQILSTGVVSLIVLFAIVVYFYGFTAKRFSQNVDDIISIINEQYAANTSQELENRAITFDQWTREDVFGLAIEFNTTKELGEQMIGWQAEDPEFILLAVVDKNGDVIEAANGSQLRSAHELKGRRLADAETVLSAGSKSVIFTQSAALEALGAQSNATYMFVYPARGSDGNRVGAFIAYTGWNGVNTLTQASADKLNALELNGAVSFVAIPEKKLLISASDGANGHAGVDAFINEHAAAGANKVVETELAGENMLVGTTPVKLPDSFAADYNTVQPTFVSLLSKKTVMAALNDTLTRIIILAVLSNILILAISYFISSRISRRIRKIAGVADKMAKGDISTEIEVTSNDEIKDLVVSFKELSRYIGDMTTAANKIAANDLTVTVWPRSEQDELGKSFQTMIENLTGMIISLQENARELSSSATEITATSEQMASGARNQSQQTAQVSSAIQQMSATIMESSQNAGVARESAESSSEISEKGRLTVSSTIDGLIKITEAANDAHRIVNDLAQASLRIGEITSVIDDIADQTNLLALNAAIEAARAGEQGRGFAVVADEVRKLAERTGKATGEINDMINSIQSDSERAVQSMERASSLVEEGKEHADEAGVSLNEINTMAMRVKDMIVQIAVSTDEQSAAAEEISKNVEHIENVARETAAGADQSASAAEKLTQQAENLNKMIAIFKVQHKTST